ncbi:Putative conserved plasma membrane protein [Trichuris trichiura]|uniref:Putative conserved plasma membrane protein n=1 Tax=Trichuris trichiura TaxID=36087 RepID=A0A077YVK8_TRITR|nr:Putative conserved plasma membrane protein [Trichuris trichiura]
MALSSDKVCVKQLVSLRLPSAAEENEKNNHSCEQSWTIQIMLKKGKNLAVCDANGSSDPYVKFKYNGKPVHKSKIVYQNVNPVWNERFSFIASNMSLPLHLQVYDYDRFASDDFMGSAKLYLNAFKENKYYPLTGNSQMNILHVSLVEGRGLLPIIINETANLPDPFVRLKIGNERLKSKAVTRTLQPKWNEKFTFHVHESKEDEELELVVQDRRKDIFLGNNVKDMYSVLEVTVYDEDPNGRTEFLGKVAIPLYKIEDGRKRWYRLKNAKLTQMAKGRILLEGKIYWNPIRASLRTFVPREKKFISQDEKFKRQIFMRYVNRLRCSASSVVEMITMTKQILCWENPMKSFLALITFTSVVYFFQLYMVPLVLLAIFAQGLLKKQFSGEKNENKVSKHSLEVKFQEERKSLRSRLIAAQEAMCTVQGVLGYLACLVERIRNLFNFTEPFLSSIACLALVTGFFILYYIPVRWLIIIWGLNKFTKRLRDPNAVQNNELLDFLSRIPSEDEQRMFEEVPYEVRTTKSGSKKQRSSQGIT